MPPRPPVPEPRAQPPRGPVSVVLRLLLGLVALGLPILAFWLATSTALLIGLGRGAAIAAAAVTVIGLPLAWDIWAENRHQQKSPPTERITSRADRIRFRILAVSLAFSASMLFGMNRTMTDAMAERGDWFLDGADTPFAREVRTGLHKVAAGIGRTFGPRHGATSLQQQPMMNSPGESISDAQTDLNPAAPVSMAATPATARNWPVAATPDPVVVGLTETRTRTIAAVGAHIKARLADPFARVKAIHDFAILYLSFDFQGLHTPPPPATQTAEAVFASRLATSRGYANLVAAIGASAGLAIEVVNGRTRYMGTDHIAFDHAWNAVDIGGQWHFVDAARDAGVLLGNDFAPGYGTTWLFAPAEVMAIDHLADDPVWSLPGAPTEPQAFLAGTALSARAIPMGLVPGDIPTRLVAGHPYFSLEIGNPNGVTLLATAWSPDEGVSASCSPPTRDPRARFGCQLGTARRWMLVLHASTEPGGPFMPVALLRILQGHAL